MEISGNTVSVLKNFAAINSNIVIKPGNSLMTISPAKNILAKAELPETFENCIGIYDLQEFLNVLGLVDNPNVKFEENHMVIKSQSGRENLRYYYADIEMLTQPTKPINMPDEDVWFTLDENTLNSLKRASAALGTSQFCIEPSAGAIKLSVFDPENATANEYSIEVDGGYKEEDFRFILNIANLKMITDTYDVRVSSKLISEFKGQNTNVTYWVALEKTSTYGEQ